MASVKIDAGTEDDERIKHWLAVYRESTDVDQRCAAAAELDKLLRAPAWPA